MPVDNVESLREACAIGDVDGVASILQRGAVDVNDRHAINGWTALHWASKRGHSTIVDLLLKVGLAVENVTQIATAGMLLQLTRIL